MTRLERTILQVVPRLDSGGAERSSLEIAGAVCRAGGRAIVVTRGGRLARDIENAGGNGQGEASNKNTQTFMRCDDSGCAREIDAAPDALGECHKEKHNLSKDARCPI